MKKGDKVELIDKKFTPNKLVLLGFYTVKEIIDGFTVDGQPSPVIILEEMPGTAFEKSLFKVIEND